MKKKRDIPFLEELQTAPRIQWGRRPLPEYHNSERDVASALLMGLILGALIMGALWSLTLPRDTMDLNHDGKVTCTDLLQAKRLEIDIKDRILGIEVTP